jgi:MFS family permease
MQRALKWWQWLLTGAGCCVVAIITGPLADRLGYATFMGLIASILAGIACTVCWTIGIIRFAKWVWSR